MSPVKKNAEQEFFSRLLQEEDGGTRSNSKVESSLSDMRQEISTTLSISTEEQNALASRQLLHELEKNSPEKTKAIDLRRTVAAVAITPPYPWYRGYHREPKPLPPGPYSPLSEFRDIKKVADTIIPQNQTESEHSATAVRPDNLNDEEEVEESRGEGEEEDSDTEGEEEDPTTEDKSLQQQDMSFESSEEFNRRFGNPMGRC